MDEPFVFDGDARRARRDRISRWDRGRGRGWFAYARGAAGKRVLVSRAAVLCGDEQRGSDSAALAERSRKGRGSKSFLARLTSRDLFQGFDARQQMAQAAGDCLDLIGVGNVVVVESLRLSGAGAQRAAKGEPELLVRPISRALKPILLALGMCKWGGKAHGRGAAGALAHTCTRKSPAPPRHTGSAPEQRAWQR